MINEFSGRNISAFSVVTTQPSYEFLSISGEDWLQASGLPRRQWASYVGMKLFDLAMLFFISIVLDSLGCFFIERTREWYFNQSRRPQRTTVSSTFDADASSGHGAAHADPDKQQSEWPSSLSVHNISYYVPLPSKRKPLRCTWRSILNPCLAACFGKGKGEGDGDERAKEDEQESGIEEEKNELQLLAGVNARFSRGRMTGM